MPSQPQPECWLGAPCSGGLALPSATPAADTLYGPRGVYLDQQRLIVADTGNHRVLIWHAHPTGDHAPADVVLGQPDFTTEGPNHGGPARGLHLPSDVAVVAGNLVVADGWNHRLLVWDGIPTANYVAPAQVLGQPDFTSIAVNAGRERSATTFNWPFGFLVENDCWTILDTGNRRVLGFKGMPVDGASPAFLIGQNDPTLGEENRGGPACANSFRWPHAAVCFDGHLWIADAGNHRVLGWPTDSVGDTSASVVIGQLDFTSNSEFVLARQGPARLRFPYGVAANRDWLAVADTANNRILCWGRRDWAATPAGAEATHVLGQPDFFANGENHWKAVTHHTLCWPYGVAIHQDLLAVADSGNNRVMLWRLPAAAASSTQTEKDRIAICA